MRACSDVSSTIFGCVQAGRSRRLTDLMKPQTIADMARLGGFARAKKLSKDARRESASRAAKAKWKKWRAERRKAKGAAA
jgi:hypothetical protein